MRKGLLLLGVLLVSVLVLSACSVAILGLIPVSSETSGEGEPGLPVEEVEVLPVEDINATPDSGESGTGNDQNATVQDLSFTAAEFIDESAGIRIFYPVEWSVSPLEQVGERGDQAALLSVGSTLEQVVEGGARIILTTNKWDPKNDLAAYIDQRRLAWDASGFEILSEERFSLDDGRVVELFHVKVGDGNETLFSFTTAGEDYLQVFGDGDLELCSEIIRSMQAVE